MVPSLVHSSVGASWWRTIRGLNCFMESVRLSSGIEEVPLDRLAMLEEDKVYVAVAAEIKAGKANLLWAVQNHPGATVVILHVHSPAQMIPMWGKFPANSLNSEQVNDYRQLERKKMNKKLDEHLVLCSQMKVKVEKLVIENADVTQGLVELIAQFGITKLVMGAAADKHYSRKMKELKSKTAISVNQLAYSSCMIWFVCKGKLICIRDANQLAYPRASSASASSVSASQRSMSIQSEQSISSSLPSMENELLNLLQSPLKDQLRNTTQTENPISASQNFISTQSTQWRSRQGGSTNTWEVASISSLMSARLPALHTEEENINSGSVLLPNEAESLSLSPEHDYSEDMHFLSLNYEPEDLSCDADLLSKFESLLKEVENLKREAYEESSKRRKAEMQLILTHQKVKASEILYAKEARHREELEEALDQEKMEVEKLKNQQAEALHKERTVIEKLKIQQSEKSMQLKSAIDQMMEMELKLTESVRFTKETEEQLCMTRYLLHSLQEKYNILQGEKDNVLKEAAELRKNIDSGNSWAYKSEFSYLDLEQATQNFSNALMIGEGGYGKVYKGFLRNTTVAIKMLHQSSLQGQDEFHQEVSVLTRVRHPNLVTLIGACSDVLALIYEFLPNGSLEDCLAQINSTPPLTWKVRTRIIAEICSALIFLHSNKPHPVVHGDLKPDNILLDANLVSKLSDFGICRFLVESNTSTTLCRRTVPKGTLAYIDPEFLITGELEPRSDVYAFGIIILRLLTGKPALGIAREVQEALDKGYLHSIIDPSSGDWPFVQAKQLAHLGLRCCDMNRRNRPALVGEVWKVVEPMMKAASLSASSTSFNSQTDENFRIPSYLICPIFQEIMTDPHIAADGFTYEAEAIKGWMDGGHDTSPMTNLKLANCDLIPNRALRAAIQEWLQCQQAR